MDPSNVESGYDRCLDCPMCVRKRWTDRACSEFEEIFVRVTPPLVNEYCQVFFNFVLEQVMRRACQV